MIHIPVVLDCPIIVQVDYVPRDAWLLAPGELLVKVTIDHVRVRLQSTSDIAPATSGLTHTARIVDHGATTSSRRELEAGAHFACLKDGATGRLHATNLVPKARHFLWAE